MRLRSGRSPGFLRESRNSRTSMHRSCCQRSPMRRRDRGRRGGPCDLAGCTGRLECRSRPKPATLRSFRRRARTRMRRPKGARQAFPHGVGGARSSHGVGRVEHVDVPAWHVGQVVVLRITFAYAMTNPARGSDLHPCASFERATPGGALNVDRKLWRASARRARDQEPGSVGDRIEGDPTGGIDVRHGYPVRWCVERAPWNQDGDRNAVRLHLGVHRSQVRLERCLDAA